MSLLESIQSPSDLRALTKQQLPQCAEEIREWMLDTVSKCGGHLAPSLGAVELTIALHYCYNTPVDKLIWDVGHQAYAHKILTGRRDAFATLRQYGGISGFPRISESDYDTVSAGHASTSISVGLGLAKARDLKNEHFNVVSILGDASISGGLAFEGLNNLGMLDTDMTIVLNDNEMSISKNVGALSKYLTRMITDKRYNKIKGEIWELLGGISHVGKKIQTVVHSVDDAIKHVLTPGKFFEDIGIRYIGPIDGHNINDLIDVFNFTKQSAKGPVLVHVLTKKGKGYRFAEADATKYHGIGTFSKSTGTIPQSTSPSYSEVFGKSLTEIAEKQDKVVAITAAMPDGTGLNFFQDRFPTRFFDVGIAEGHAITFASGLALQGFCPVVALYSTFMQRAFDQMIHDVALDNLHVVVCLDRAGLVGNDGPTHHGTFDISFLRTIPGVTIMAPSDGAELRSMLFTAITECTGPVVIRYPRGNASGDALDTPLTTIPLFKPEITRKGTTCAFIACGDYRALAGEACRLLEKESITPTMINARFVKPLDTTFYQEILKTHSHIVTLESNARAGGFGSAILELAAESGLTNKFLTLGYPDTFIPHGDTKLLLESIQLTPAAVAKQIAHFITK